MIWPRYYKYYNITVLQYYSIIGNDMCGEMNRLAVA